jgi:hypothetical protein
VILQEFISENGFLAWLQNNLCAFTGTSLTAIPLQAADGELL